MLIFIVQGLPSEMFFEIQHAKTRLKISNFYFLSKIVILKGLLLTKELKIKSYSQSMAITRKMYKTTNTILYLIRLIAQEYRQFVKKEI